MNTDREEQMYVWRNLHGVMDVLLEGEKGAKSFCFCHFLLALLSGVRALVRGNVP